MYLMRQVSGLPLLSRSILALHGIPFCGLLGLGGGGTGVEVFCLFVLFCAFIFVSLSFCDLSCFPRLWFGVGVCLFEVLIWGFIDKELEDIHKTCFRTLGSNSSPWKHTEVREA